MPRSNGSNGRYRALTVLEICAGAGGQALGLEQAGFEPVCLVEIDGDACNTLRRNRPRWRVEQADIHDFSAHEFSGVDLLAAGVPCPPFSIAGKQLGANDERDLFPTTLRLIAEARPRAVLLENVRGFASARFENYRRELFNQLATLGYDVRSQVINASDYGVPQLRPRWVLVAFNPALPAPFPWPRPRSTTKTVGGVLSRLMSQGGWTGADRWRAQANSIAPTIVGGSKKHGGPDLGPTRARKEWRSLGVDGLGIADEPPRANFPADGVPRLTVPMVAKLQGFPASWRFVGGKTSAYRQVGNAFPPPVAKAVGKEIAHVLLGNTHERIRRNGGWKVSQGSTQGMLLTERRKPYDVLQATASR